MEENLVGGGCDERSGSLRCDPLLANTNPQNFDLQVSWANSKDKQEKIVDRYRYQMSETATNCSKKIGSNSSPNQRSQIEEIPVYSNSPMKRSRYSSSKSNSSFVYGDTVHNERNTKCGMKRKKRSYESIAKVRETKEQYRVGRWTRLEHFKFLEALKIFGKEWQKVQQHVNTRTSTQARSHAQKFFVKLDKKQLTLEEFLEGLDIELLKIQLRIDEAGDSTEYDEDLPLINIANQKYKGSVMNIALPGEAYKVQPADYKIRIPQIEEESHNYSSNQNESNIMKIAYNQEHDNYEVKRSPIQRKAKTNHAFFSGNYTHEAIKADESVKRRRLMEDNEEVIVRSGYDTKIWISNYAVQQYEEEQKGEHQEEINELDQYMKEMQAHSELDEIYDNPRSCIKNTQDREFGYNETFVLNHHQESIDDIINGSNKKNDFKAFNVIPNDSHLGSMIYLNSLHNDWKEESINFNESKQMKMDDKLRIETVEDGILF